MTISNEMKERIEAAMAGLRRDEYLRVDRSYNEFVREMGQLIAQAKQDQEAPAAAGMEFGEMPFYDDIDRYNRDYAIAARRTARADDEAAAIEDALAAEDILAAAEEASAIAATAAAI